MAHSINADRSMSYDQRLKRAILERFVQYIKPMNIIFYFGKHAEHLLVPADYQRVRAVTNNEGDQAGAYVLLDCLCVYRDWFSCLITVLRDPKVKLSHVADKLEADKRSLDLRLQQVELDGGNPEEESFHDGNVDEAIENLHIEHEEKVKQLQQENEKLCHRIREDHRPCELRATQLEQQKEQELKSYQDQVRELKKEREQELKSYQDQLRELKKERDQLIFERDTQITNLRNAIGNLEMERKRQVTYQLIFECNTQITNLRNAKGNLELERKRWVRSKKEISDLLSATQENDGVILFNYCVMCRMREEHPDLAKKYKIQEWSLPSHLQDTAFWRFLYIEVSVREVREGGLTAAKEIIQTELRVILNKVNMRKEEAMNEDEEKYWLQRDIIGFFRDCYSCLIGLGHNDAVFKQCLGYIHHIIDQDIDTLLSDWADVLSKDTYDKGVQAIEQAKLQAWKQAQFQLLEAEWDEW